MSTLFPMLAIFALLLFGNILHSIGPMTHGSQNDIQNTTSSIPEGGNVKDGVSKSSAVTTLTEATIATPGPVLSGDTGAIKGPNWPTFLKPGPKQVGRPNEKPVRPIWRKNPILRLVVDRYQEPMPFVFPFGGRPVYPTTTTASTTPKPNPTSSVHPEAPAPSEERPHFRHWRLFKGMLLPKLLTGPVATPRPASSGLLVYTKLSSSHRRLEREVDDLRGVRAFLGQAQHQQKLPFPGTDEGIVKKTLEIRVNCNQQKRLRTVSNLIEATLFFLMLLMLCWMLFLVHNVSDKLTNLTSQCRGNNNNRNKRHLMVMKV